MDELWRMGIRAVPVTVIDGTVIVGFKPDELTKALGLS
jgi:predicted DsbA family dithiol-disulfide isomerase